MDRILVDFGFFHITYYSVFILLGVFFGGIVVLRESRRKNLSLDFMSNLIFWMVIFGIIGARLYYVAFNWDYYSTDLLNIVKTWEGGLAIHGAIIADLIFLLVYARRYKLKMMLLLDVLVPGLILGQAIGRWGNFFNQEAHGGEVTKAFLQNMHLPSFIINGMSVNGVYYHPTFLYESLWCLLGFIVLLIIKKYKYLKLGQLTGVYFMWYAVGRFFIEALRTDSLMLGNFKAAQLVSIVLFIVGLIILGKCSQGSKFENLYKESVVTNEIKF